MAKVNSDEVQAYVAGTIDPLRAREIPRQAESDDESAASIWLLRGLYGSNVDIQSRKLAFADVHIADAVPQFVGRYKLTK
jgi:hypothetical protein